MRKILVKLTAFVVSVMLCLLLVCCKKEQPSAPKGSLLLETSPAGAEVYYNGKKIGVTPYEVKGVPKSYLLKLTHPTCNDKFVVIDLKEGENSLPKIELSPVETSCLVVTEPAGATVIMGGKNIGVTPLIIRDLTIGKHELKLQKSGYAEKYIQLAIDAASPKKITEKLVSNIGVAIIKTEPAGVAIYHNDKFLGETPFKIELSEGTYNFVCKKTDYLTLNTEDVIIESGKEKTFNYTLSLLPATLKVNCPVDGAEIYLDDKLVGVTPGVVENLEANHEFQIYIKAKNYVSDSQKITLSPGKTHEFFYDLKRNVGDVEIFVNVPGISIYVDGHKYGVSAPSTNSTEAEVFKITDLAVGTHTLKISHRRSKPESITKKFEIKPDSTVSLKNLKLWIPNIMLQMKDGSTEVGLIISTNKQEGYIFFESQPGLRYSVNYSDIEKIIPLKDEE